MYNPQKRFSRNLIFKKLNNFTWLVIDGCDNIAGKIEDKDGFYKVEYINSSFRFIDKEERYSFLGNYKNLKDAKKIIELHETCKTTPVFIPGAIKGWVDKDRNISLAEISNSKKSIWDFIKKIFK